MTFRVWLLGGGALRAWRRSFARPCGDSRIRLAWRALLRGLMAARFATLEARTARAFGAGRPLPGRQTSISDWFFGGFIRRSVGAGLGNRARWCRRRFRFFPDAVGLAVTKFAAGCSAASKGSWTAAWLTSGALSYAAVSPSTTDGV